MARRGIDMLPLLDVFMVVLFVFATIQEQQIDSSAHALDELRAAVEEARAERAQADAQVEALTGERDRLRARTENLTRREQELREQVESYERADPDAGARAAMAGLHERLLDNIAVFEIEIDGRADLDANKLRNPCCFRADPPNGEWQSCGEVPSEPNERLLWLDDGGHGLIAGLNRNRGGQAIVILRQSGDARQYLTASLAELLRERMPDYRIYDDSINGGPLQCPLFGS